MDTPGQQCGLGRTCSMETVNRDLLHKNNTHTINNTQQASPENTMIGKTYFTLKMTLFALAVDVIAPKIGKLDRLILFRSFIIHFRYS